MSDIVKSDITQVAERVFIQGDLSQLSPDERIQYYKAVCESVGLNPLTKPFDYIQLSGKLTLYARKDATDQLRFKHQVSIQDVDVQINDDYVTVKAKAALPDGRTDFDLGVVSLSNQRGDARANAIMKAITKAKRRVTLSICGLGWLDETEIETIPGAVVIPEAIEWTEDVFETTEKPNGNSLPQMLVDAGVAQNIPNAANIINKMPAKYRDNYEAALAIGKLYRGIRDGGENDTKEAMKKAVASYIQ